MARLLEDGTPRLLEDGTPRLLEGESANVAITISLVETIQLSNTVAKLEGRHRALTETLGIGDSVGVSLSTSHAKQVTVTEQLDIGDTVTVVFKGVPIVVLHNRMDLSARATAVFTPIIPPVVPPEVPPVIPPPVVIIGPVGKIRRMSQQRVQRGSP